MKLMQKVSVAVARNSARIAGVRQTTRMPVRTSSANDGAAGCGTTVSRLPMLRDQQRRRDEGEGVDGDRDRRGQPRDQRAA